VTLVRELYDRLTDSPECKPTPLPISVLDHGLVELEDWMGNDLRVVVAAEASFNKASDTYGDRQRGILRKLMAEEHGVPFEHVVFTYRLRLPLFLAAQFKKHRHGSWSERSARYSPMERLFYVPDGDDVRRQVGKAMDYTFEEVPEHMAVAFRQDLRETSNRAFNLYERWKDYGVAKEQARLILPQNTYTTVVWTLNARSLFNFLRLRADSHAQREAQVYAEAMERLAATVIPDTIDAFVAAGRPKP
jgi:thymidylate synthase (FAD)